MLVVELFDKLLDSLNLVGDVEFTRKLPALSSLCDQVLFSVGVISCLVVMSSGVLGTHRKKRVCMTAVSFQGQSF